MADPSPPAATTWLGDLAWRYASGDLTVIVLPRRGGKIASIVSQGREWLTQPVKPLLPLDALPATLVDGDMFGWDECAPTIDDCEVQGRPMPLHGEVWSQPWDDIGGGWLAVRGCRFAYELRRRLTMRPDGFRLDYVLLGGEDMPFLWAAHPQFAATGDTRLEFGDSSPPLVDIFARGYWSDLDHLASVSVSDIPERRSAKLFVAPERPTGRASLIRPDGTLTMTWDQSIAPWVGVWMDRGGIGPVEAVAIEPMTGYADSCAVAFENDRVLQLAAGSEFRWWVELQIV